MIEGNKIAFLSFADIRLRRTLDRIRGEAEAMGCFDAIYCWNQTNLDPSFWERHEAFIRKNRRGYGFWIWKAQCVKQVLALIPEGSILLYADAGCCLNREGLSRLADYCRMVVEHQAHRLVFELEDFHHEEKWTKEYTLQQLGFSSPQQRRSPQLCATVFLLQKTPGNLEFIDGFSQGTQEYDLINDRTLVPNSKAFKDHRHDQSIWSILNKHSPPAVLKDETWFCDAWELNRHFPVHARRLKY